MTLNKTNPVLPSRAATNMTRRSLISRTLAFSAIPALTPSTHLWAKEQAPQLGIILVGASWCPWCHAAAEQLHTASLQWGWPVLIAALDNRAIPPFDDFIPSQDHPLTSGINRLPTTLLVEPKTDHIVTAFEGYKGPVPYLSRIANTMDAFLAKEGAHG